MPYLTIIRYSQALMGQYRWAMSGTPVKNNPLEFMSYLRFFDMKNVDTLRQFAQKYYSSPDKLKAVLNEIMIRRTHLDKFLGVPLLKLPEAAESVQMLPFNSFERLLYDMVYKRILERIGRCMTMRSKGQRYSSIFYLLMKLRQLTGHVFLIRTTLQEFLKKDDLKKLKSIASEESENLDRKDELLALRQILSVAETYDMKKTISNCCDSRIEYQPNNVGGTKEPIVSHEVGGPFGLHYDARPLLNNIAKTQLAMKREAKRKKSAGETCNLCDFVPDQPWITECEHLYCFQCFAEHQKCAKDNCEERIICVECGAICQSIEESNYNIDQHHNLNSATLRRISIVKEEERKRRKDLDIANLLSGKEVLPSAKTSAVKCQIQNWLDTDQKLKIIVYTHFVDM